MSTPAQIVQNKLGKNTGFGYQAQAPTVLGQNATTQNATQQPTTDTTFADRLKSRISSGNNLYNSNKQENTNNLATDLINKSAGLKFDQFGKPQVNLADFGQIGQNSIKSTTQYGNLATQTAEAQRDYQTALATQNLSQYGISGTFSVTGPSGTDIPGASANNVGAQVAAGAMRVMQNGTKYVWGGNSLVNGIDCSGLVQQLYRQLGVNLPRTTYEQAKAGKIVSVGQIRPGDLVFYGNDYHHVGIYYGNGKIVHAANSRLGVIESNLTNSNGAPTLVVRPY